MQELPSIYKPNKNIKKNNKEYCYVKKRDNIEEELDKVFNSLGPISKKKVYIQTIKEEIETYLLKRTQDEITTIEDKKIKIDEIITIKRIS